MDANAKAWEGDSEKFLELYQELRRIAGNVLPRNGVTTLQPTVLVNEAWLKMRTGVEKIENREHYLRLAARAMHQIVVDHLRRKGSAKRRATGTRVLLDVVADQLAASASSDDALAVGEAIQRYEAVDRQGAQILFLRFYLSMQIGEIAALVGVGNSTVDRSLRAARAWLATALRPGTQ